MHRPTKTPKPAKRVTKSIRLTPDEAAELAQLVEGTAYAEAALLKIDLALRSSCTSRGGELPRSGLTCRETSMASVLEKVEILQAVGAGKLTDQALTKIIQGEID